MCLAAFSPANLQTLIFPVYCSKLARSVHQGGESRGELWRTREKFSDVERHIERERERERETAPATETERERLMYYIYICIYTHIKRQKEEGEGERESVGRERERESG